MRDPYFYDDCDILKNNMGIKDSAVLDLAEVEFACNAIHELAYEPLMGDYNFELYCKMHFHIFRDLYDWAGIPRTVSMEKQEAILGYMSIEYAQPEEIAEQAGYVLDRMNRRNWGEMDISEQAEFLSQDMADLWKVHCFREGNTRVTITFVCQFADDHGMPIDRKLFEENAGYTRIALVAASAVFQDADFRKMEYLVKIVRDSLERGRTSQGRWRNPGEGEK